MTKGKLEGVCRFDDDEPARTKARCRSSATHHSIQLPIRPRRLARQRQHHTGGLNVRVRVGIALSMIRRPETGQISDKRFNVNRDISAK